MYSSITNMLHLKNEIKLLFFALLIFNSTLGQELFLGHTLHYTPERSPANSFNETDYHDALISKYTPIIKKTSELNEFASALTESKKYYVLSNTEYEQMGEAVSYLEKIVSKLEFERSVNFKIKIIRDPSINACAFEDGTIYVNIGLLARYESEAQIAAILGHEVGHVLKQHAYRSYVTHKEYFKSTYYNMYNPQQSLLGTLIKTNKLSSRLITQEEESDEVSMNALKSSSYNSKALVQCFQLFKNEDLKYRSTIGNNNGFSLFYLRTHPTSDKRLAKANALVDNSGKNFLVDSIYFETLKQQAIDETINLYFEGQDFEECMAMAFVEHLKKPNDPFYLFYITECLRRSIAYDPKYSSYYFITGQYRSTFCNKAFTEGSIIAKTNNEIKPLKKNDHCILLNLAGLILINDSSEYKDFKAGDLINEDTLEFVTNADALAYFKQKNDQHQFALNNRFFSTTCETPEAKREKYFCDLPSEVNAFATKEKNKKYLFMLYDVDHIVTEKNGLYSNDQMAIVHDTYKTIYSNVKNNNVENDIVTDSVFNFSEKNHLFDYLKLIYPLIEHKDLKKPTVKMALQMIGGNYSQDDMVTRDSANFKSQTIAPELIAILDKHNIDGIIYSDVTIEENSSSNMYSDMSSKKWTVRHFYLDAKTQKVRYYCSANCMYITSSIGFGSDRYVDMYECFYKTIRDLLK